MQLFFIPELEASDSIVTLGEEETRHCFRALRLIEGDSILMTNGKGLKAIGKLCGDNKKMANVEIISIETINQPKAQLHLAVAPTKNHDRFEWFVEKATELGVQQITPLICRHSERKNIQDARLQRLIIAALKQSQEFFLPELQDATTIDLLINKGFAGQKFIAWCGDEIKPTLQSSVTPGIPAQILIGPEGDFSDEEVSLALKSGYIPISLGRKRLRTETAALAACHIFNIINDV